MLEILNRIIWGSLLQIDARVLASGPPHITPLELAREIYHRYLATLIAQRLYWQQGFTIAIAFPLSMYSSIFPDGGYYSYSYSMTVFVVSTLAMFFVVAPIGLMVTSLLNLNAMKAEAQGVIRRTFLRELPPDVPEDLRDIWRHSWLAAGDRPLSSELTEADYRTDPTNKRTLWWLIVSVAAGAGVAGIYGPMWLWTPVVVVVAVLWLMFDKNPVEERARQLDVQEAVEGAMFVAAGGQAWAQISESALLRQAMEAKRDTTTLVQLGRSTGLFAAREDFYAPSAGLPFAISLQDLHMHILGLGGVGSGKTSCLLRPIAYQAASDPHTGLVVADGKSALPNELADLPGMQIIDPATATLSLVAGLDATTVIEIIIAKLGPQSENGGGRDNPFFTESAADALRQAAVLLHAAGDRYWTFENLDRFLFEADFRTQTTTDLRPDRVNAQVNQAMRFFTENWSTYREDTRNDIIATVRSWLARIMSHPDLARWAKTTPDEDSIDITCPLRGGRIGLLIPAYRYGEGPAAAVTALLKARIYASLKERAERGLLAGETRVVFIIDEAQEVITPEDSTMLAMGRSLGLAMICATQTVEGVAEKLGPVSAQKWLNVFGSVVAFSNRSPDTDEFVAARAGSSWRPLVRAVEGLPVRTAIQAQAVTGQNAAALYQTSIRETRPMNGGELHPIKGITTAIKRVFQGEPPQAKPQSQLGAFPLIESGEVQQLVAEPDTALALITRGRVMRRDLIKMTPMYEVPKTDHEPALEHDKQTLDTNNVGTTTAFSRIDLLAGVKGP